MNSLSGVIENFRLRSRSCFASIKTGVTNLRTSTGPTSCMTSDPPSTSDKTLALEPPVQRTGWRSGSNVAERRCLNSADNEIFEQIIIRFLTTIGL